MHGHRSHPFCWESLARRGVASERIGKMPDIRPHGWSAALSPGRPWPKLLGGDNNTQIGLRGLFEIEFGRAEQQKGVVAYV